MPLPKLAPVNCSRGAPMGRCNTFDLDPETNDRFCLQAMRMVDGDYDSGGAYWGGWSREHGGMWHAYCCNGHGEEAELFIRAKTREQAKEQVREHYPNARFFR